MTDVVAIAIRVERALRNAAELADCKFTVNERVSRPWASATFNGSRHTFSLTLPATHRAEDWLAEIPVMTLDIHRQLLADAQVLRLAKIGSKILATIELLLVAT